jgi:hypothetical protein
MVGVDYIPQAIDAARFGGTTGAPKPLGAGNDKTPAEELGL